MAKPKSIHSAEGSWRCETVFIRFAIAVLFVSGIAKVYSAFFTNPSELGIMTQIEPIFGAPFKVIFLFAGLVELLVAFGCLVLRNNTLRLGAIVGLAVHILFYRVGLWILDYKKPCSCLGSISEALRIDPEVADSIMLIVLCMLLTVGGFLLWNRSVREISSPKSMEAS